MKERVKIMGKKNNHHFTHKNFLYYMDLWPLFSAFEINPFFNKSRFIYINIYIFTAKTK